MNRLYLLNPEVAGGFGDRSIIEYQNGRLKNVKFLNYEFNVWLGDELLTSTPCFVVTKFLANNIIKNQMTGCVFENLIVTKSDEFKEFYPHKRLPDFVRLLPTGIVEIEDNRIRNWSGHDFCLNKGLYLLVTKNALDVISNHEIAHCKIEEINFI
jgi:hypothetical protein